MRGIFDTETDEYLDLPHLGSFRVAELLTQARRTGIYQTLAGMVSRYYLHGLRLPTEGIRPKAGNGMWVHDGNLPKEAGLFALTGQLVSVPLPIESTFTLCFAREPDAPDWLELPNGYTVAVEPGGADAIRLEALADFLKKGALPLPCSRLEEDTFRPAAWSFAAPAALEDGRKLWMLPSALLKLDAPGFRPVLSLSLERYDEASGGHRSIPLNTFQYAALVTFRVRRASGKGLYPVFCSGAQTPRRLEQMLESLGPQPAALQLLCHSGDGYRILDRGIVDLVQTDLSTESHPPVAENLAKPGTADLLMLLWQALVTNNGGTCLYYWAEDAGLPAEIFSQSGDAELAFLFPLASDGQLPAWCDCLVSGEDIPAGMTLNARASEQPHTVSYAGESPVALQRYHLTSLTSLLRRNKRLIVQAESIWQVCHALYQAAETAAPGLTPDSIARYFAVSPSELQAENLWKKNWEEPFSEGDLVLLPPFSVKAQAGETLESLAQRCGVQPLTLLWQNREQTGRFQADQELTLDACPGSCFSSLVPGCLAEAFQRKEPGEVPDVPDGSDDYARAMLSNSATLLRYRVEKTPWFDASSASSVPVSPDKDWRYAVSFPAASYAGKNEYEVIGSAVRLHYEWIDLYGNRIETDPAALESTRLIGYTDSLLPISRWPSFTAAWRLSGDEAHPVFELSLQFSPERYHVSGPEGMDEAGQDLTLLRIAYAQITDPKGIALTLHTSLLGSGGTGFPADQCTRLADYLLAVREFLKARAAGQSAQAPEQALVLCFQLKPAELCTDRLFPVEASVEITRSAPPMAGYEEVDQIVQAECPITPDTGDLTAFARSLETAFPQVSLAAAANDASKGLWALRRECRAGDGGLYFDIPKEQPVLYAPRPISNRLESRSGVRVYRYTPGQVLSEQDIEVRSFQNADLNVWLRELVDAMDSVFVPETAAAVRRMDDSRQEALYPILAGARRALADALSTLLVPLYEGQQPIAAETAQENFRQKLLSRLNEFYEVRAILLYHTEIRSGLAGAISPRLYGELDYGTRENATGVSLASARLPLESGSEQFLAATLQGPGIVRGGGGEILPSLTLGAVWCPSHVEYDIRRPEGFGGYEDSGWLSLLLPEQYRRTLEQTLVPLPLASFPQTPFLSGQSCESGESLWMWRYCFAYSLDVHYPQNVLHCTVRFNETGENYSAGADKLFQSLARCHMACGSLSRDISANAAKAADAVEAASIFDAALRSLVLVSGETAEALRSEAIGGHIRNDGPGAIHFTIREGAGTQGELLVFVEGAEGIEVQVSPEQYAAEPVENGVWHYRDRQTGALLPASEGQTAALRTVLLPPVNLFVSQSAKASLFAEQNRGLVPDRELSEYFLFTTGETTFPEPCFPVKTVTEETDMTACLGRPGTIREHLDAFFATLPDETDALFQIQASYRRRLLNGVPDFPLAETPVFLQTPIAVTKKELSSCTVAWADALSGWRREHFGEVGWSEDEDIHLEITILSTLTKNPSPMLTIKHAVLPGRMLKL